MGCIESTESLDTVSGLSYQRQSQKNRAGILRRLSRKKTKKKAGLTPSSLQVGTSDAGLDLEAITVSHHWHFPRWSHSHIHNWWHHHHTSVSVLNTDSETAGTSLELHPVNRNNSLVRKQNNQRMPSLTAASGVCAMAYTNLLAMVSQPSVL